MYSPKVVERNIERVGAYLQKKYELPRKWVLAPSSSEEIKEMREHFQGLLDDKGVPVRELTKEESLWVLVQSTLAKLDFRYFATNFVPIEGWDAKIVFFKPNVAQEMFLGELAFAEERGWAQMWQILKARQLGFTTLWQALLAHRVFLYRNVKAITGSAAEDKSRTMVGKIGFIWSEMDWWLRPNRTAFEAGKLMEFKELNSEIRVNWGNQKTGIGRGATPSVAHLSELASFENPEDLVDASLVRTQHENPFSLMGFESTAEGVGDWWNRTWDVNMKFSAKGMARMQPRFFPWYVGKDLYPTKAWINRRPVPSDWTPPEYVEAHARAAKVYVDSTPMLRKGLGDEWQMPLEQKWFYFVEFEEAREKRTVNLFLQEMPATPEEAFQSSNPTVFGIETLAEVRTNAQESKPVGSFEIVGREIPAIYSPGRGVGRSYPLVCRDSGGRELERFSLEKLPLDSWPDFDPDGRLYIWEWPIVGEEYGLGVDPAEGVDQDSSVIQVVKKATPWHPDEQVAEWSSKKVQPHDLWAFVFALAHLYTTETPMGQAVFPRIVVETNIAAGDAVQTELLKRGWPNFHQQQDFTKLGAMDGAQRDPRDLRKIGWRTTVATRPKVISIARKMIRDGMLVVRSPFLAKEMATLEYNLDKKRIEASQGNHDDRFMALGMLLASWYDPEVYGTAPQAWREQRAREIELEKPAVYMGNMAIGQRARRYMDAPRVTPRDSRRIRL